MHLGVENALHKKIVKAINPKWLEAIKSATLRFTHTRPLELLNHLSDGGEDLNNMDVTELMGKLTKPWEVKENPATKFAHNDKIKHQLIRAGFPAQTPLCLALTMSAFKATGKNDKQIYDFDAKPAVNHTFNTFRPFIINKHSKCTKQNRSTAKSVHFGIADGIEEAPMTRHMWTMTKLWKFSRLPMPRNWHRTNRPRN